MHSLATQTSTAYFEITFIPSPVATEIRTQYASANDCLPQLSAPGILVKGLVLIHTMSE